MNQISYQIIKELLIKLVKQCYNDIVNGAIAVVFENGHLNVKRCSKDDPITFNIDFKLV